MSAPTNSRKTPPRKTGPKVPKGWRVLSRGTHLQSGDMFRASDAPHHWIATGFDPGERLTAIIIETNGIYIRRQPRQRRK